MVVRAGSVRGAPTKVVPSDDGRAAPRDALPRRRDVALLHAARRGDDVAVQRLIKAGANVNAMAEGTTPLYVAAEEGHIVVLGLLIGKGADVNRCTEDGETPVFIAAMHGFSGIVEWLVGKGADMNRITVNGATPLNAAAFYGHSSVVNFLMEKGAE